MSLITSCPACGTIFKVVADQLKVSGGWVRCGHCSEVFDGQAALQNKPLAELMPEPVPGPVPAPAPEVPEPVAPVEVPEPLPEAQPVADEPSLDFTVPPEPAPQPGQVPVPDSGPAAPSEPVPVPGAVWAAAPRAQPDDSGFEDSVQPPDPALEQVSFVRKARAKAFWRRPLVRLGLATVCVLLLGVLALQVAYVERDRIAALEPRTRPWLQLLCEHADCSVEPLRQAESLLIDSSSFTKLRPDVYRLSVVVKNVAPIELAMPSLDVALTDTQDQPVLRRVLAPADLGAGSTLAASGEFTGVVHLQVDRTPVAGYRVLAFYP